MLHNLYQQTVVNCFIMKSNYIPARTWNIIILLQFSHKNIYYVVLFWCNKHRSIYTTELIHSYVYSYNSWYFYFGYFVYYANHEIAMCWLVEWLCDCDQITLKNSYEFNYVSFLLSMLSFVCMLIALAMC